MASYSGGSGASTTAKTTSTTDTPPPATMVVFWDADHADQYIQFRDPSPWLRGKLADKPVPGLMDVKVSGATRKVDVQSPPSKGGAKIVVKGWSPSEVKIKITIWTSEQFEAWQKLKPLIRVDSAATNTVSIFHPVAEEASVSSIVIKNVSGLEDGSITGTKVITIDATDATTQKSTGTGTAKGGKVDVLKVAYIEYVKLQRDILKTTWQDWVTWCMFHQGLNPPPPPFAGYAAYAPSGVP